MSSVSTAEAQADGKPRIIGLDGVRAIAAVTVLVGHVAVHIGSNPSQPFIVRQILGYMSQGLTLFFVLSGFLLFLPFAKSLATERSFPSIRAYSVNRVLRILPAYWVIFAVCAFVLGVTYVHPIASWMGTADVDQLVGRMSDPGTVVANLFLVQNFIPSTVKTGLSVAWTLTLEASFYVAMPLVAAVAFRFRKRLGSIAVIAPALVFIVVGIVGKVLVVALSGVAPEGTAFYLAWGGNWYAILSMSILPNADLFGFGMLMVPIYLWLANQRHSAGRYWVARLAPVLVGMLAIVVLGGSRFNDTGYAMASAGLVLFVAAPTGPSGRSGLLAHLLHFWPVRMLGEISYSVYLWHVPVIWWLAEHALVLPTEDPALFLPNTLIVLAVTIALATVTYLAVERPAMLLRSRLGGTKPPQAPHEKQSESPREVPSDAETGVVS